MKEESVNVENATKIRSVNLYNSSSNNSSFCKIPGRVDIKDLMSKVREKKKKAKKRKFNFFRFNWFSCGNYRNNCLFINNIKILVLLFFIVHYKIVIKIMSKFFKIGQNKKTIINQY